MKCPKCGKNTYYFTEGCYQEDIKISPDTGGCSSCGYRYLEGKDDKVSLCEKCVHKKAKSFMSAGSAQCLRCSENYDLLFTKKIKG